MTTETIDPRRLKEITIQLDWSDEPAPAFANGAQVAATTREFALFFTEFCPLAGRGGATEEDPPLAKIVASVRMTPDGFFHMISTCASNWNRYANHVETTQGPRPKFKLMGAGGLQLEGLAAE
ncbi:MAG: hypothetical protein KF729_00200 [Sandaracinaceae bacterium]|nr:hypothetical protein [Sandaracinaceae bacterium]